MFKTPSDIKDHSDTLATFKDIFDNISLANMNPSDLRTTAPTADEVNSGGYATAEISGVPHIFYKTTSGVLFKYVGVAV